MLMPYYEVPVEILEDREWLSDWARKALFASKNSLSKAKKGKSTKFGGVQTKGDKTY